MTQRSGKIIIPADASIWPHELETARALARVGHSVEFMSRTEGNLVKSPDIVMDGIAWEMKAPKSSGERHLDRVLRRAPKQSPNIIIDALRMESARDAEVQKQLLKLSRKIKAVRRLLLVKTNRELVDIK